MRYAICLILGCWFLSGSVIAEDQPVPVSLIELIATPQEFDGKLVSVVGFLMLEERAVLGLHREDVEQDLPNAIGLVATGEMRRHQEELNGMYVVIVGVFHVTPGPGGRPVRQIRDIKGCRVWSDPARPLNPYPYGRKRLKPEGK
jgi:hypothetical protein